MTIRDDWGESRVFYYDEERRLKVIPTEWTSLWPRDPFVVAAAGRALFRAIDLLRLAELLDRVSERAA